MATTIKQSFLKFKSNLEITDLQQSTVSTRQQSVRDAVTVDLNVNDSFLTGSYRRSTMIAPLKDADVDVFIVLDPSYFKHGGQAWLLDKVKTALKKTYKTPSVSRNGQAVTITFSDFKVDVVPSFLRQGGGYLIADSINANWISTDPKKHVDIWTAANIEHNGSLVPLIKMIKGWNREHSALLRSFHLEAMVLKILDNVTISSFSSGARFVFDEMRQTVRRTTIDPAGYGSDLSEYLDTNAKIDSVMSRLETAYKRATDAESLEAAGKIVEAVDKWRLIFGYQFPAYG